MKACPHSVIHSSSCGIAISQICTLLCLIHWHLDFLTDYLKIKLTKAQIKSNGLPAVGKERKG